uniref:Arginine vasopressin-induced protein 1 n=1 Tax=Haplochromis burtoni TaxID=8153 RepID=A0A3Q2XI80_HAPBU
MHFVCAPSNESFYFKKHIGLRFDRRSRKAGSANIFSNVNLWQLQRLFRAAGDQDAEQRAQLIWGHGDEAELAKALIGLRARSHHKGLRTNGRDALGTHWLRAFSHLR